MDAQSGDRGWLRQVKPISGRQFAVFRLALGAYLFVHFAQLIPYAAELFSTGGVLPDARANLTSGLFPSLLALCDSPRGGFVFVSGLAVLSFCFMVGALRRVAAVLLWYGMACLFNRNNLIANPSLPYMGMLLLLTATVPPGEPWSLTRPATHRAWFFPLWTFRAAWILMAAGYTIGGVDKLLFSPSWTDGTAVRHVLNLPLARPGMLRDLLLNLPQWMLSILTFAVLALEILAVPLCLYRRTRPWYWLAMVATHGVIILLIDFADLSIGMLMLHLFTLDPEWAGQ
jgi:hypothetical protein